MISEEMQSLTDQIEMMEKAQSIINDSWELTQEQNDNYAVALAQIQNLVISSQVHFEGCYSVHPMCMVQMLEKKVEELESENADLKRRKIRGKKKRKVKKS